MSYDEQRMSDKIDAGIASYEEKIDRLLAGKPERIEMFQKYAAFRAAIIVMARDGDVVDILYQVCKGAREVSNKFTEHIMICPLPMVKHRKAK
jgi:hypothetical protein